MYSSAGYGGASPSPPPSPAYTDWNTFGDNVNGTNYNGNETTLTSANVQNITLKWSTDLASPITAQPVLATGIGVNGVSHNLLYVGTEGGVFYAVDVLQALPRPRRKNSRWNPIAIINLSA